MKNSKSLRKSLSVFLCVCLSMLNLPVFAATVDHDVAFEKVELSDVVMEQTVGASGSVDVKMSDHTVINDPVQAVLSNRTAIGFNYSMVVTNSAGTVLEVLDAGQVQAGTAILITGTPTLTSNGDNYQYVRTSMTNGTIPALNSTDSSAAQR